MTAAFDPEAIEKHGWRQGAVLGPTLLKAARERCPLGIAIDDSDWLIVTTHDCDVVNGRLDKEPFVELLRASVAERNVPDKQQAGGRNPRQLQLAVEVDSVSLVLTCCVHDRWTLPRELLATEAPLRHLEDKHRRLIAEWLAKRYIRAAFPSSFDARWHKKLKDWTALLGKHSRWVQGVYLRLNTLDELGEESPYLCHLIVAVPSNCEEAPDWRDEREELERDIEDFWSQFKPKIECVGVDIQSTSELTLAAIEPYQRFDADWVSFADDSPTTPMIADMRG